ncbi:hypothetical protein [Paraburkholderia aromaticivorans]|uniref:hypothetical protein n=1 Tax=Paraburkholderia aromaticivorans TaxID=2026199 RepID=UPI00145620B9|nr:hypothetical protein [Paraburkholderia aromaticivorans]
MKVLIDEAEFPELHAKLSDARHPRARAEMLRRMASTYLIERARTGPVTVMPAATETPASSTTPANQPRPTVIQAPTDSRSEADIPNEIADRFVGNMGRFLIGNDP